MTTQGLPPTLFGFVRGALVVVGFSPLWVVPARSMPVLAWLAEALDCWFGIQCHRDPGRTLELAGLEIAVCARCMGIYLGLGLGGLLARPRLSPGGVRLWMWLAVSLMVIDMGTELLGLRPPVAVLRGLTGA